MLDGLYLVLAVWDSLKESITLMALLSWCSSLLLPLALCYVYVLSFGAWLLLIRVKLDVSQSCFLPPTPMSLLLYSGLALVVSDLFLPTPTPLSSFSSYLLAISCCVLFSQEAEAGGEAMVVAKETCCCQLHFGTHSILVGH